MSARDSILKRIRAALAGEPEADPPPVPELWPRTDGDSSAPTPPGDLAESFLEEFEKVQGEGYLCASIAEAQQRLVELAGQLAWEKIGVADHPLCRAAVAGLEPTRLVWVGSGVGDRPPTPDPRPLTLAALPVGVLPAEFLMADTGTAVVMAGCPAMRLLCYLPPIAVLLAEMGNLVAHMSDMWDCLSRLAGDPAVRGELVLVTGPSRTADIEKKLVLGAHGPKRLIVLIVADLA